MVFKNAHKKEENIISGIYGAVPYYDLEWYFNILIDEIKILMDIK